MGFLDKWLSKTPEKSEFARIMIEAFRRTGLHDIDYQESNFSLKIRGTDRVIYLSNAYSSYCSADKRSRDTVVAKYVSGAVSVPDVPPSYAIAKPNLMPVVRDASYYSLAELTFRAQGGDTKSSTPTSPLSGELVVGLAYDAEHSMTMLYQKNLDDWNVTLDQALKDATDNLRDRTDPNLLSEEAPDVYVGRWGDSYESARMLLTDLVYRLSVDGDPVVFVPNRNSFWVTGKDNPTALAKLLQLGEKSHFGAHPLSPNLYSLDDGMWRLYIPNDVALRKSWLAIKRRRDALDYTQQKESLDAIHEKEDRYIFVANCRIFERKDGTGLMSACSWARGVDSLLPKTDYLFFVVDPDAEDIVQLPWGDALPIVGSLLEEQPDLKPIRYRVRSFPDERQLKELRTLAVR